MSILGQGLLIETDVRTIEKDIRTSDRVRALRRNEDFDPILNPFLFAIGLLGFEKFKVYFHERNICLIYRVC